MCVFAASGCEGVRGETDEAVPMWTDLTRIPYEEMWEDDAIWCRCAGAEEVLWVFVFDGEN